MAKKPAAPPAGGDNRRMAYSLVAGSAILTSLSFVPYNIFPLGFISLLPLFYLYENFAPTTKRLFALWAVFTLILNLIGYHWIMHTIAVYGMMPTAVAFPLFLLYSLGTGGKMLLFFFFLRFMQRRADLFSTNAKKIAAVPAAFAICELVGWQLFPWHGGNIVSGDLWFAQAADLIGTRGLSVLWVLVQYLLYIAVKEYFGQGRPSILSFLRQNRAMQIFAGVLVAIHLYGAVRVADFEAREQSAPKLLVGVPQGNVPLITSYHERPYIITRMLGQTQKLVADAAAAGRRPDLVVWPESSIPAMEFERSETLRAAINDLQRSTQTPLIINDILHEAAQRRDYSNMWHLNAEGTPLNNYQKNFLLPFGEFMPLGDTFPSLKNLFPAVSDFSHGKRYSLFNISSNAGNVKAMPLICYEVILPEYARGFDSKTMKEAQFIINITNDAWFGKSVESLQHMTLGVMRAIELRLPIVRATNSGISAYIASTGAVSGETPMFERVNQLYSVPAMPRAVTLFAIAGNIPLYAYLVLTALVIWFRRKKK
jgi:apolipoprotein N-acyltransferase